jgi:hypothetical protein
MLLLLPYVLQILLGRPTKDCGVDVNLLEDCIGQNNKISRRQVRGRVFI